MVRFIIVRHGFSLSNKDGTFTGQLDIGLSEEGRLQAELVSDYVINNYKIDAFYSSDLSRAYDTVKKAASYFNLPVNTEKGFREFYCGYWEGKTAAEVSRLYPEDYARWMANDDDSGMTGGETRKQVRERAMRALDRIAKENDGKTVLIATHGGVIKMMQSKWDDPENLIAGKPWVTNASISIVEYDGGKYTLKVSGYDDFLGDLRTEMPKGI